jgi:hypothetical protein
MDNISLRDKGFFISRINNSSDIGENKACSSILVSNNERPVTSAWADIQRRGPILAWIVILSVYGADTIAIDLSLSALIS